MHTTSNSSYCFNNVNVYINYLFYFIKFIEGALKVLRIVKWYLTHEDKKKLYNFFFKDIFY